MRYLRPAPRLCAFLCGILTLVGFAVLAAPASAKSFVFTRVAIEATVGTDGSLGIVESRTYAFDGQFSWATYRLPLRRAAAIRDVRMADDRGPYAESLSGRPGTFLVTGDDEAVVIRWAFHAANESRTFTIGYVIDDVVMVYDDVAELYWKFIGTGWDRPSEDVRVTVWLPGRLRADEIRAWGHGPLHGDVRPVDGGAVLAVRNLAVGTMVEGRIVFPKQAVPGARMRLPGAALPRILREEGAWAEQANRTRLLQRGALGGLLALPVLALGGWVLLYLRFGREPVPTPPEGYYRELPANYSPADLGVLWRFGSVQPADFTATVLDLARRGYIRIEVGDDPAASDRDREYTLVRTGMGGDLLGFETEALTILFGGDRDHGDRVTISRGDGLPPVAKKRMARRFSRWTGLVSQAARVHRFFDPTSMKLRAVALVLGILIVFGGWWAGLILSAVFDVPGLIPAGVAASISGLVLSIGSGAVRRRSQRGADDLRRWQGFRQFLLDFSEMRRAEVPSLALWEHYLVYAVPLGVADRVIAQLRKIFPAEELASSPGLRPWTASSARGASGSGGDPLASFSAFTTAFSAATSSASSGSGGGGGFSGGGGGGGGGSGGSAG